MMPNAIPPQAPGGAPPAGGRPSPENVKQQIIQVLQAAKMAAEESGLDFAQLVAEVSKGGAGSAPPPPAPAGPPMPM